MDTRRQRPPQYGWELLEPVTCARTQRQEVGDPAGAVQLRCSMRSAGFSVFRAMSCRCPFNALPPEPAPGTWRSPAEESSSRWGRAGEQEPRHPLPV